MLKVILVDISYKIYNWLLNKDIQKNIHQYLHRNKFIVNKIKHKIIYEDDCC